MAQRLLDYSHDAESMARRLMGQRVVRIHNGKRLSGRIVEVEAYLGMEDRASHTFDGRRTARNASMYLPGGHAYVYFIYGMHHCLNIVCGAKDEGVAVLLRAVEPEEGIMTMRQNRPTPASDARLCAGPACLAKALAVDRAFDGEDLKKSDCLWIEETHPNWMPDEMVERSPRVGVDYAGEWAGKPLRFVLRGSPAISTLGTARLWKSKAKGR